MAKSQQELDDERRQMTRGAPPGGGSSRGPEIDPGGKIEPQGLVPPYERSDSPEARATAAEGVHKAFRAQEYGGEPGSNPPVSKEECDGVPPTDTTAATPLGVGESSRTGGEELAGKEAGRIETGTQGTTRRPTGTSTAQDVTGVNPQGSAHGGPDQKSDE